MNGRFSEPIGINFDYTGASYDHALIVTMCGIGALLLSSFIRRIWFIYPEKHSETNLKGLFSLYKKYRKIFLLIFLIIFLTVSLTNAFFGIYQRGCIPRIQLPYKIGGIYTWLLLFGSASIAALLMEFELILNNKPTYSVAILTLLETFFSSVSMLSRGMILNVGSLAVGMLQSFKMHSIKPGIRFYLIVLGIFIFLFGGSIFLVSQLRTNYYSEKTENRDQMTFSKAKSKAKTLLLDRLPGIEGTIAVSSYTGLGWDLWKRAWKEKYANQGTSFYDLEIAKSGYRQMDFSKHHFISLPRLIAFLFYPGSLVFLFVSMLLAGTLAAAIEMSIYKLLGTNVILIALLSQVIASRYTHFGYVPGQSYLLFGTLALNVLMISTFDRFLLYLNLKLNRNEIPAV